MMIIVLKYGGMMIIVLKYGGNYYKYGDGKQVKTE
jgi:hypothetical protein